MSLLFTLWIALLTYPCFASDSKDCAEGARHIASSDGFLAGAVVARTVAKIKVDPKWGASGLLYRGRQLDEGSIVIPPTLRSAKKHLQFVWNEAGHVGIIFSSVGLAHVSLAAMIPEGVEILGGTRYVPKEQQKFELITSQTYKDKPGPELQQHYFDIQLEVAQ